MLGWCRVDLSYALGALPMRRSLKHVFKLFDAPGVLVRRVCGSTATICGWQAAAFLPWHWLVALGHPGRDFIM